MTPLKDLLDEIDKYLSSGRVPDCGDNSCYSNQGAGGDNSSYFNQGAGGMRTNGGCRCQQKASDQGRSMGALLSLVFMFFTKWPEFRAAIVALMEENESLKKDVWYTHLKNERDRYKTALEFYATPQRYYVPGDRIEPQHKVLAVFDDGQMAREALGKEKS